MGMFAQWYLRHNWILTFSIDPCFIPHLVEGLLLFATLGQGSWAVSIQKFVCFCL